MNQSKLYTPKVLTALIVAIAAIVAVVSYATLVYDDVGWSILLLLPIWAVTTITLLAATVAGLTGHIETGFWLALAGPAFLVFIAIASNIGFIYPALAIFLLVVIIRMIIKKDRSRILLWIAIVLELLIIWSLVRTWFWN